ncbi:hypothetical protein JR334_10205 [Clostridia bacterium]|nr:hypothetical protein JR334_10205 [Clostridia bacterium]
MERRIDVVGLGDPCIDFIIGIPFLPKDNESLEIEDYSAQGGGKVATALCVLGKMGYKTELIGSTGKDNFGDRIIKELEEFGVDIEHVNRLNAPSSFSVVLTNRDTKSRSILWRHGCSQKSDGKLADSLLGSSRYFYCADYSEVTLEWLKVARRLECETIFDGDFFDMGFEKIIPYIDHLIVSEEFYLDYQKSQGQVAIESFLRQLSELGPKVVILTLGDRGLVASCDSNIFTLPAYSVEVQDTLGAGDVFHGAYVAALLDGKRDREACEFASASAAVSTLGVGGRSAIMEKDKILAFMESGTIDNDCLNQNIERYRNKFLGGKVYE